MSVNFCWARLPIRHLCDLGMLLWLGVVPSLKVSPHHLVNHLLLTTWNGFHQLKEKPGKITQRPIGRTFNHLVTHAWRQLSSQTIIGREFLSVSTGGRLWYEQKEFVLHVVEMSEDMIPTQTHSQFSPSKLILACDLQYSAFFSTVILLLFLGNHLYTVSTSSPLKWTTPDSLLIPKLPKRPRVKTKGLGCGLYGAQEDSTSTSSRGIGLGGGGEGEGSVTVCVFFRLPRESQEYTMRS